MRVGLDVTPALAGVSGMRFYIESLLHGLAAVGPEHEYFLCCAFWSSPGRIGELRLPRGPNFRVAFRRVPQRLLLPAEELGWGSEERRFQRLGLDLFHGLGHLLPRLRRLPGVATVHHVGGLPAGAAAWDRFYLEWLSRRSARRARVVLTVSEFTRSEAVRSWGLDPARVFAVPEGGPAAAFSPGDLGEEARRGPYLLHVGAFLERKNIPVLVRAFRLWLDSDPARREKLVLAGRPGPDSARVQALVGELGLEGRVETLPGVGAERLVRLYRGALAAVVPSVLEGFGFPVLEAMACGTPVLAAAVGSLPEVAGDAALLFDPLDSAGLAGLLGRLAAEPDLAAELRRRGLERARGFSWEEAARGTLAAYRRALGG